MRVHPKNLPTAEEVKQMMMKEAQRIPSSKKHFPDFNTVNKWLEALGIRSEMFINARTLEEVALQANIIKPLVVEKTLVMKPLFELKRVERYLGEEDELEPVDVAIVFGGKTVSRADKGAEMYLKGFAKKLLMTGKGPNYSGVFNRPEADIFKDRAIELGVPEDKIIIENKSINIPDNVKASLNMLDAGGIKYGSLMQIISWYAQRRAWVALRKYADPKVKLVRVNADLPKSDGRPNHYEKGVWYETAEGIEIVFNEFVKMRNQVLTNSG